MRTAVQLAVLLATFLLALGCTSGPTPGTANQDPAPAALEQGSGSAEETATGAAQESEKDKAKILFEQYDIETCKDECVLILQKILDLDPNYTRAHSALAGAYWVAGNRVAAEEVCDEMMTLFPDSADTYMCLLYHLPGTREERFRRLQKAVELDPTDPYSRGQLAWFTLRAIGRDRPLTAEEVSVAIDHYRASLRLASHHNTNAVTFFAELLVRDYGRYEESAEFIIFTAETMESETAIRNTCSEFGRFDPVDYQGVESYAKLMKILQFRGAKGFEAKRHLQEGKVEMAIFAYEDQLKSNPYHRDSVLALPQLYIDMNQPEKARTVLEKYLELEHDLGERCDIHAKLVGQGYDALAPELFAQLKQECAAAED